MWITLSTYIRKLLVYKDKPSRVGCGLRQDFHLDSMHHASGEKRCIPPLSPLPAPLVQCHIFVRRREGFICLCETEVAVVQGLLRQIAGAPIGWGW
jgi:hypothetical protein